MRELGVTTIRYPGGNFVSGYRWEDGVGPRESRPRRLDLAWHSTETNEVGLDEFAAWLRKVGSELMYAVNLGTRGVQEALDVLEYANIRSGTTSRDQRIANGAVEPHGIRMWCLGNEMDGPWQLGHGTAEDYGRLASKTARAMRQLDPDLELVVCGSSSAQMPTFGDWERVVLEETYDDVDYISCHAYYEPKDGDYASFLASAVEHGPVHRLGRRDRRPRQGGARQRQDDHISFDEWNVWYQSRYPTSTASPDPHEWPVAPRLLEDAYSVVDAVVFGNLLISLHPPRRPGHVGEPRAARERHRADHDRAGRTGMAADDVLPVRPDLRARPGRGPRAQARLPDLRLRALRRGARSSTPSRPTTPRPDDTAVFMVNRSLDEAVTVEIDIEHPRRRLGRFIPQTPPRRRHPRGQHAGRSGAVSPQRPNDSAQRSNGSLAVTLPPVSWSAVTLG